MRLGGFFAAENVDQLEPLCGQLDARGLSAIGAPRRTPEMSDRECVAFGEQAGSRGIIVGAADPDGRA